jgi:hypothetical protein
MTWGMPIPCLPFLRGRFSKMQADNERRAGGVAIAVGALTKSCKRLDLERSSHYSVHRWRIRSDAYACRSSS